MSDCVAAVCPGYGPRGFFVGASMPSATGSVGAARVAYICGPGAPFPGSSSSFPLPFTPIELVASLLDVRTLEELDKLEERAAELGLIQPVVAKAFCAARRRLKEFAPPELLNAAQAAKLLGVSAMFVYRRARPGGIPFRRVGRFLRFVREDVIAWSQSEQAQQTLRRRRVILREVA